MTLLRTPFTRGSAPFALVLAGAVAAGCGEAATSPTSRRVAAVADVSDGNRLPELAGCEQLAAPAGSTLVLEAFAIGAQVYRWTGTSWGFVAPSATLYATARARGHLATHFGGPTWQSTSGGTVVGTVAERCTPDAASIPWLALTAVPAGPGVFATVAFIQRLNTVGGNAPATAGGVVGEQARVPYTADYLFYQAP